MTVLYVMSDREGDGKTSVCAALAHLASLRGRKAATLKPLTAAGGAGSEPDADIYEKLLGQRQPPGWPRKADGGGLAPELADQIAETVGQESGEADVVLIEAANNLSMEDSRVFARALDAEILLVLRHRPQSPVDASGLREALGDRLAGSLINGIGRYAGAEVRERLVPAMEAEGLRPIGAVPEDRRVLGVSVGQLASHLGGRFIVCEDGADALVEHLMVGGYGMDPGELTFRLRDDKAVIVRGDRPDVQMSALATHTACMVLTKGIEPIEYVRYEAEQEEVPVMVVETDTLSTMDGLNTLMAHARFDHRLKLERFAELLERHADLAAFWRLLGVEG